MKHLLLAALVLGCAAAGARAADEKKDKNPVVVISTSVGDIKVELDPDKARGTIAMARTPDPDSATSQFYINVVDNDALDKAKASDKVGYCVFGKVIEGMDVVDKIKNVKVSGSTPVQEVVIKSVRRAR